MVWPAHVGACLSVAEATLWMCLRAVWVPCEVLACASKQACSYLQHRTPCLCNTGPHATQDRPATQDPMCALWPVHSHMVCVTAVWPQPCTLERVCLQQVGTSCMPAGRGPPQLQCGCLAPVGMPAAWSCMCPVNALMVAAPRSGQSGTLLEGAVWNCGHLAAGGGCPGTPHWAAAWHGTARPDCDA